MEKKHRKNCIKKGYMMCVCTTIHKYIIYIHIMHQYIIFKTLTDTYPVAKDDQKPNESLSSYGKHREGTAVLGACSSTKSFQENQIL